MRTDDKKTDGPEQQPKPVVPEANTDSAKKDELGEEELASATGGCCNGGHYTH